MRTLHRREALKSGSLLLAALLASDAWAGPRKRRRVRRRIKRRVRRRIRRRVLWRTVGPRRALVVPIALAVGWELAVAAEKANEPDVIVVVKEVKVVEKREVLVTVTPDGKVREIDVDREDNADNGKDLPGTELAAADVAPSVDAEIEEEVEVDE